MEELELICENFIDKHTLVTELSSKSNYSIEIGGDDDMIFVSDATENIIIIWTIENTDIDKEANFAEAKESFTIAKIKTPLEKYYNYYIEFRDSEILNIILNIFKSYNETVYLLYDDSSKFIKAV
ncbi:MAG: hypothetical protein RR348_01335 [Clostridia bacterium]